MNAVSDNRPYCKTDIPGATPDAPRGDESSNSVPWNGKLIFFADHAVKVKRLFLLLGSHLGQFYSMDDLQREHDGHVTSEELGYTTDEVKKARQRIRTAISRIKDKLLESKLDDHFAILHEDDGPRVDGYTMFYRYARPSSPNCPKSGVSSN
jgi:hypothetical protein